MMPYVWGVWGSPLTETGLWCSNCVLRCGAVVSICGFVKTGEEDFFWGRVSNIYKITLQAYQHGGGEVYSALVCCYMTFRNVFIHWYSIDHCEAFFACLLEGCRELSTIQSFSSCLRVSLKILLFTENDIKYFPRDLVGCLIVAWFKTYLWWPEADLLNKSGDFLSSSSWYFCFVETIQGLWNNIVKCKIKRQYPPNLGMIRHFLIPYSQWI